MSYARSIVSARTCQAAAVALLTRGLWPVACHPPGLDLGRGKPSEGKEPIGSGWGAERWDLGKIRREFRKQPRAGVGVCLGPGRGPDGRWLIDLEGDGPEAEASRLELFGGELVETLGWSSTRGGHQLLVVDGDRLGSILPRLGRYEARGANQSGKYLLPDFPGLEFRLGGFKPDGTAKQFQSVVPPTPGTDGTPRQWNGVEGIAEAPEAFYASLEAVADRLEAEAPPRPTPRPRPSNNGSRPDVETRAVAYLAKCDPAISGQGGHNATFKAACKVGPGFDLDPEAAVRLLLAEYSPRCDPPWTEAEVRHKVEDAYRVETRRGWLREADRGNGHLNGSAKPAEAPGGSKRPEIELTTERHEVVSEALDALRRDPDLYRRGDVLVTVAAEVEVEVDLTSSSRLRNAAGAPKVIPLSAPVIGCRLTRVASLYTWKQSKGGEPIAAPAHPPDWLSQTLHTLGHYPGVRPLLAVVECPYMRGDGTIVEAPGYDPETGALYRPSLKFPAVPARPSQEDAREAAERLRALVKQFPFSGPADYAAWLAGLLTAVNRPAIRGPVPGIAINGNAAGVGKGLLIDLVGIVTTGRNIPTTGYPDDKREAQKVKVAIALSSRPVVHFDNLDDGSAYGNSALDSALTSTAINDRILGQSKETGDIPMAVTWFLSGNRIAPGKDAYRRWLPVNLVSPLERPEERDDLDIPDLRTHATANRGELVKACLTILRAHALAGHPSASKAPLGSFEEWDRLIRGAVHFATGLDPCQTRRAAAEEAPERRRKLALLEGWRELPGGDDGGSGVTAAKALELVKAEPERCPTLHPALLELSRNNELPSSRSLGNRIRAIHGANIGGMVFEIAGEDHKVIRWRVATVPLDHPDPTDPHGSTGLNGSELSPSAEVSDPSIRVDGNRKRAKNDSTQTPQTRRPPGSGVVIDDPDDPVFGGF